MHNPKGMAHRNDPATSHEATMWDRMDREDRAWLCNEHQPLGHPAGNDRRWSAQWINVPWRPVEVRLPERTQPSGTVIDTA